jgi:hypothetical protein
MEKTKKQIVQQTPKDPKNLPCECGSKLKAKKCCLKGCTSISSEYTLGQEESSSNIIECIKMLQTKFPNHKIIDITSKLTYNYYKQFQIANYYNSTIMVAEKTDTNTNVFETRTESSLSNIMVMYHGSFRTFPFDYLDRVFVSVCDMIK